MTHPAAPLPRPHPGVGLHEVPAHRPGRTRLEAWVSWHGEEVYVWECLSVLVCAETLARMEEWVMEQNAAGPLELRPPPVHLQLV